VAANGILYLIEIVALIRSIRSTVIYDDHHKIGQRKYRMKVRKISALCSLLLLFPIAVINRTNTQSEEKRMPFTVPEAPWTLLLPKGDFVLKQVNIKPNLREGYFSIQDEKTNLVVSMYIEPVDKCKDSESCRDMIQKLGNPTWKNLQDINKSKFGDVSYFEFLLPSFQGQEVKQQNMYVEWVKDGYWVDMHISKIMYDPKEHVLFEDLVKSVRFDPNKTAPKGD
jgi:hypothetical protein